MSPTGASGNFGVMDCEAALMWVRDNAQRFGGDPARVTIMGQSSGATMAWALVAHPRPAPLFRGAIILSGSPNITMSRPDAERQNAGLAEAVGCGGPGAAAAEVVRCLRHTASAAALSYGHAPINTTWQEYDPLTWGVPDPAFPGGWPLPGVVIVDGDFLPQSLEAAVAADVNGDVALLVSNVGEESDLCPRRDFSSNRTAEALLAFLSEALAPWGKGDPAFGRNLVLEHYADELATGGPQQAYLQLSAHVGAACGQLHLLGLAAAAATTPSTHRPLYYANVAAGPSLPQTLGVADEPDYVSRFAYHQYDLLWGMESWNWFADFNGVAARYLPTDDDRAQAALFRRIWLEFARGAASPGGMPLFANASGTGAYTVGLIGKRSVAASVGWRATLCAEFEAAALWRTLWWAN